MPDARGGNAAVIEARQPNAGVARLEVRGGLDARDCVHLDDGSFVLAVAAPVQAQKTYDPVASDAEFRLCMPMPMPMPMPLSGHAAGCIVAQVMTHVLRTAGNDLTRENLRHRPATSRTRTCDSTASSSSRSVSAANDMNIRQGK
ncbi:hypothetical protein D3C86_1626120 [compost metagenome]